MRHPAQQLLADSDRPRERLQALGCEALSESELLALLLGPGGPGRDALGLGRALLERCGSLRELVRASRAELARTRGMGPAKTAALLAAIEIGRRVAAQRIRLGDPIRSPADIHRHFYARLRDALHERFIAVLLDGRHRVRGEVVVSQGTLTASLVHPREVFRPALQAAAAALVLVHNHPSGDPTPSREDREVTERLGRAGEILGVRVIDHVVVAEHGYYSFSEAGAMGRPDSPP